MNYFVDPFLDNGFLQRALFAGVLVSLTCAVVGTYVVLRGMAFIGDALAHGVLPGVAGALLMGLPAMLGAAVGAAVMVGGIGLITAKSKLSNDTAIGLLFIGLLALGVVMVSSSRELTGDLEAILFGQFLGVNHAELLMQSLALLIVVIVTVFASRPFSLLCFDSDLTRAMGYQAHWYHRLMLFLIAATVVVSFQTVGALLVFGMLLAPAGVGALLARRIVTMMLWAAAVGVMSTYLGLLASYHFSWAAGASVVLTAVTIFFVALVGVSVKKSLSGLRS